MRLSLRNSNAAHSIFSCDGGWSANLGAGQLDDRTEGLDEAPLHELVVTNSIPVKDPEQLPSLRVVSVAPLLGEAIKRIHRNESVSYLFD